MNLQLWSFFVPLCFLNFRTVISTVVSEWNSDTNMPIN